MQTQSQPLYQGQEFTTVIEMRRSQCFIAFLVFQSFRFPPGAKAFTLTVLHTNDLHARFVETDENGFLCLPKRAQDGECFGGVARRATVIKRTRAEEDNVLLLDAGDVFTGTLWYAVYRGNATSKFLNELEYDAMTLGNHDFDDGVDNLARFLKKLDFPVVVSNLNVSKEPKLNSPLVAATSILTVAGEKIGIVGYVLQITPKISHPGPGPNVTFLSEVESVKAAVEKLRQQGVNKIIALGHAGINTDKKVAEEVDGIDIVIGGHSNTFLYTGKPPSVETPYGPYPLVVKSKVNGENRVPVVQAFAYGKYLGRLKVTFDEQGRAIEWSGNPILLDASVPKNKTVEEEVLKMKRAVDRISEVRVGRTLVPLRAGRSSCLIAECNLGNVVTDAFVFHYANMSARAGQWTEASIAIQNSGSITAPIDLTAQGFITYGQILNSFPYQNKVDLVGLKGKDLLALFEQSMERYEKKKPTTSLLQVSGLKLYYDVTKPPGNRVVKLLVRCASCPVPQYQSLDTAAVYKVVLPSYLARGGAGLTVIQEKRVSHTSSDLVDSEVIMNYLKAKSPLTTGIEGRIVFLDEAKDGNHEDCVNGGSTTGLNVIEMFLPFLISILRPFL